MISWPSRCGAIVIPASGDAETVNCAETQVEATDRRTVESRGRRRWRGLLFTWCLDSIIDGWMVGANRPHEAKQTAAKHGCKKCIKCSIEEKDEA